MVLAKFYVTLDKDNCVFFPGQEITGSVHVWNDKPKNVNGIYVDCRGSAQVSFTRTEQQMNTIYRNGRSHNVVKNITTHYQSNESYFRHRITINAGGSDRTLGKGKHQFPFSLILPHQIPSSFEGVHGNVRYTIRAVYERRRKWNHECKIPITVNSIMDLNQIPESSVPVQASGYKTLGILCCKSNPITAKFWLDRCGYVPGESIIFNAEVENLSRKAMRGTKVQIIEKTSYHATRATEFHERVINESIRGKFKDFQAWENYAIIVPPIVSSNLQFCNIIDVSYSIMFAVDPGAFSFNLKIFHNLLIGNVPLRSSFANFQQRIAHPNSQTRTENSTSITNPGREIASPISNDYPDLPPPSYEECMFGGNLRETDDSEHVVYGVGDSYKPRYLTYG
ncbi:arrestin domain-containing protein 17-like isoform X1 [Daphnia pulex]|uniref:arrestin domain-containing protein 17-like isoform X1 n=2 Tax=Daphnia pulex TaxID=6669 RepID=UPI001EDD8A7E|nr:arrestin domain-containing protein 17-like isoform X1 [Daphnia pulex]